PEEKITNVHRTLSILNDWARLDRHRRLHFVSVLPARCSPALRLPEGVTIESMNVTIPPFLEDKNVLATFRLSGYKRGMKVDVNPNLIVEIALNEAPLPESEGDGLG